MSLYIASLNSGSNGNCYYIGNDSEAVLVDAGISCREIEKRMKRLQLCLSKVKAIFISHEHSDHIRGVPVLAAKYNLPVYSTKTTLRHCPFSLPGNSVRYFKADEPVGIGGLEVVPFSKLHDAADPHSFVITHKGVNVGVFTDIGASCSNLTHYFRQCHAAFLEANYDEAMLDQGYYPVYLKNRIRGGKGHLSNIQALECFTTHQSTGLSHLILSHLSKENNCPQLAHRLFSQHTKNTRIVVASRFVETQVFTVTNTASLPVTVPVSLPESFHPVQMSLF